MQMKYIGLDCHKQYDHATMIGTDTGEIKAKRLSHIKEEFKEFIGDRTGTRMVIESCRDWSRTYELSEDLVEEVILAHSLKVNHPAACCGASLLSLTTYTNKVPHPFESQRTLITKIIQRG
jgi:hypothetical protein